VGRHQRKLVVVVFLGVVCALGQAQGINKNNINNNSPQNVRRLQISRAVYGREGKGAEVTMRVRSMIRNDSLDFKVNNTNLGGDPNEGTKKVLKMSYTYNGRRYNHNWNEGDRCRVP
jgi:hypothetical protein